tara:strand:- start:1126 stop:1647 length:522 start_codon:yes stop_codon:yes gene_type:complete
MAMYNEEQLNSMPIERLEGVATDMAAQVDDNEMALTTAMSPEGEFSMARLNAVVDGMNAVVALMPDVEDYPTFEEDIEIFPGEFVEYFNMINTALRDAALDELEIDFMTVADDRDLARLAGELKSLAKNSEFKRHLKNAGGAAAPVEEEVIEEIPIEGEPMMEEVDTLFMDRM